MSLGYLSNLSSRLKELEAAHLTAETSDLSDVRLSLVNALEDFRRSRFRLGKMLSAYKKIYLASHGWLAAAKVIAIAVGCDERTVRRIVEDYDRVSEVPAVVIDALEKAGIDPAARRNASIVAKRLLMPYDSHGPRSKKSVMDTAISERISHEPRFDPELKGHLRPSNSGGERRHVTIRNKILSTVAKVQTEQKLPELLSAIEGMYLDWGMTEPISVSVVTKKSSLELAAHPVQEYAA